MHALCQISGSHSPVIDAPRLAIDFRYRAPFRNEGAERRAGSRIEDKLSTFYLIVRSWAKIGDIYEWEKKSRYQTAGLYIFDGRLLRGRRGPRSAKNCSTKAEGSTYVGRPNYRTADQISSARLWPIHLFGYGWERAGVSGVGLALSF